MLLDNQALFSDQQALTGSAVSQNFINLGQAGTPPVAPAPVAQDIGGGNEICMLVQVTEAFAGGTSLKVELQMSDSSDFANATVAATTPVIPIADLTAGKVLPLVVIPQGTTGQYIRMNYVVVGSPTAGKVTAGVSAGNQTNG